jgi:hypothetical protein
MLRLQEKAPKELSILDHYREQLRTYIEQFMQYRKS